MNERVLSISEIRERVSIVAQRYDIREIRLFGSYFDQCATDKSDVDLVVRYGAECRGLDRIRFARDLERELEKHVDVINLGFLPDFFADIDIGARERSLYER